MCAVLWYECSWKRTVDVAGIPKEWERDSIVIQNSNVSFWKGRQVLETLRRWLHRLRVHLLRRLREWIEMFCWFCDWVILWRFCSVWRPQKFLKPAATWGLVFAWIMGPLLTRNNRFWDFKLLIHSITFKARLEDEVGIKTENRQRTRRTVWKAFQGLALDTKKLRW